jgi:UDP-N-acetylglucosamine--N-acetylmuramyl-(pentapeptide) pyrophosphoryl-undecaprenol N-acetylglucosamine transferase
VNVLFAGGGTGGHLYPAIAIADALPDATIAFVGTADRLETTIVPKAGYPLRTVLAKPLRRDPLGALVAVCAAAIGTLQSLAVVAKAKPDIVIASGGYVCFPVVLATRILRALHMSRAPIALLALDATPGVTNRALAPLVDEVWGSNPEADVRFRGRYVHTGVPVRASLRDLPRREDAMARLHLDPTKRTLLAMGGSLGARTINQAVAHLRTLPGDWQVLVVAGDAASVAAVRAEAMPGVNAIAYLDDPADAYASADVVLARAGASTVAEVVALGLPAIFVPYPHHADDHQVANASAVERAGAAIVLEDRTTDGERLAEVLASIASPDRLASLQAHARAQLLVDATTAILARIAVLTSRRTVV